MRWVFTKPVCGKVRWWLLASGLATAASGQQPPAVWLDSLVVLNEFGKPKTLWPSGTLTLPARENYLTFRLQALRPTPIRYQLVGLDNDWQRGLSPVRVHYANLPGGSYTFRWQTDGPGPGDNVPIQIDAPFWQRAWFVPVLMLYLLGVVGIMLYLFLQYRFRQKLRELRARDRIARDLHDDMGSYLSSISILSASARRYTQHDPEKARATLDSIGQMARQMLDTMGDIVWSINPAHDSMSHTIERMRDVGKALFANTEVEFTMHTSDDACTFPLMTEARRDFFLIYKEALTNAARYAEASHVRVGLVCGHRQLELTIQDNGRGFDPARPAGQNPGGGNGLPNMQVRSEQLRGVLTIRSQPGAGTTVCLLVPLPS